MNFYGSWEPRENLSFLLPRGLLGVLLYITYGDIATAESTKMTILLERRFFTSYVMMSDLKFQACRK